MNSLGDEDGFFSIRYIPKSGRNKGKETTVYYKGKNKDQIAWLSDIAYKTTDQIKLKGSISTLWDDFNWNNISKEGDITFPNGKKPIAFIQRMIELSTQGNEKEIILDFFSGSGSTAHAIIDTNSQDNGNRCFILGQLQEYIQPTNKANRDYIKYLEEEGIKPIVTEIGKERICRAGEKIRNELRATQKAQSSFLEVNNSINPEDLDIGFKVFKLDSSNLKKWNPDVENLEASLLDSIENYVDGRTELDVVYEIMLKYGIDLTLTIEEYKIGGKKIYSIGYGALVICLDQEITTDVANEIVRMKEISKPEIMRVQNPADAAQ
jgi:adenine-specific DNA-methyltransferase